MITLNEVLAIHDILIERFGGARGVRDQAGLESAINRPFQTFEGNELYPHTVDKLIRQQQSLRASFLITHFSTVTNGQLMFL